MPQVAAPQLKLGPDGKFILDDTSLVSLTRNYNDIFNDGHFRLLKQLQLVKGGELCRPESELVLAKGDPTGQRGLTKVC